MKKPPHKAVAQLNAIIERLEKWQEQNKVWVEAWKINKAKSDLLAVLRELEQARG